MKALNPFDIDLKKITLIEASAGTGKTHTITTLYCRLAADGYPVESILVVTFTEAAAAELKLRIRQRLFSALKNLSDLSSGSRMEAPGDELSVFLSRLPDPTLIQRRLKLALTCFDQAAVMTIHSFCLRVLKENAFESRSLFDIELMPDRSSFLRQAGFDFFMMCVNHKDPVFLKYLEFKKVTPERFVDMFKTVVSRPGILIKPVPEPFEINFDLYREIIGKLREMIINREKEICDLILNHPGIDKRSYTKRYVPVWLSENRMKLEQEGGNALFEMTENGDSLYKFTRTRMAQKTKPGERQPEHEFFDLCQDLLRFHQEFEKSLICLKIDFLSFFNTELDKMKKARALCFFDDLINDLAKALDCDGAQILQKAVRQTWSACLIDEFQDTDPVQYDIFSKLFLTPGTPFFMIGDPKQAIYGFRGGDIFAYLKASKQSEEKFTLEKNFRSSPMLVNAVNTVFSKEENPFLYQGIAFSKAGTPGTAKNLLILENKAVPPFQFCFIKREDMTLDKDGFISKETAEKLVPKAVAEDILSLLQSKKRLLDRKDENSEPRKISPGDIAVLVRTNAQAEEVQTALSSKGIPSYLSKTGSVFDSKEALALYDILWAVYQPENKGSLLAALCGPVFNFSSKEIAHLNQTEDLFYKWQDRFRQYRTIWETQGFVPMIMTLFHSTEAFLKTESGLDERGLTNFYHLSELVSKICLEQRFSPHYLLKWYGCRISKDTREESADELRLESDKKAVAIVTLHKSKGLEYPVVYLPFLWEGTKRLVKENILFHDPGKNYDPVLDLGSEDMETARSCFEMEERAEHRRLLYVALTRASALCRIIWGGFRSVEDSALGSLLHPAGCKDDPVMIKDLETLLPDSGQGIFIDGFAFGSKGRFKARALETYKLSARQMHQKIAPAWKMSSFSALTQSSSHSAPEDRPDMADEERSRPVTLALFPKGARTGDFFHSVFENLDFEGDPDKIPEFVQGEAGRSGLSSPGLLETACKSIKEVLETRLMKGPAGFCLKDIRKQDRINEMEFVFPVMPFEMQSVIKAFEQSGPDSPVKDYAKKLSQFSTVEFQGFMKGFIDLIVRYQGKWYIVDYKTNFLGDTYEFYSRQSLTDAMAENHYFLQYYLYVAALHKYLESRMNAYDYDTCFGGVFYLFIRGMHPDSGPDAGVFFDRPPKTAIISFPG
ncbi:MAG: exodeoxyribonuclease V subunit beta [Desulfobacterales bacterium RIFOXYA12_FULL_46_15]|nr:MAG: exodeoxyribonuclease V subunit beta [Desulfobacterales bacterium RIFOXYA12_FULL_46_15]